VLGYFIFSYIDFKLFNVSLLIQIAFFYTIHFKDPIKISILTDSLNILQTLEKAFFI